MWIITEDAAWIIVIRHGETQWNIEDRMQGFKDSPLTPLGEQQVRCAAQTLLDYPIDAIYSSDLGRAERTSSMIAEELGRDVQIEPRLRERKLGILEGYTREDFFSDYPAEAERFFSRDPNYEVPGGESSRQVYERATACLADLARRHRGQMILAVAHGGILRSLFFHTMELPLDQRRHFSLYNTAINIFKIQDDNWILETWGDVSHLRDLETIEHP